ncbi:MAG: hypothetical protein WD231_03365 [Candidatus Woykebacteria bacterium]
MKISGEITFDQIVLAGSNFLSALEKPEEHKQMTVEGYTEMFLDGLKDRGISTWDELLAEDNREIFTESDQKEADPLMRQFLAVILHEVT